MTNEYELADDTRAKPDLREAGPARAAAAGHGAAPHPMADGTDEQDYYRGKVTRATPEQEQYAAARAARTAS